MDQRFTNEDIEDVLQFYDDYKRDAIGTLAQNYPKEQQSLTVDVANEVFRFDPDLARDIQDHPEKFRELFEEALKKYDLPIDVDLSNARVRFYNAIDNEYKVDEIRKGDVDRLVTLHGQIAKASGVKPVVKDAAWECQRCGTITHIPIENTLQEPHECQGCERQGPFELDYHQSEIENHQLIRVKQPPEEATNSAQLGGEIDANVKGDLAGNINAGERANISGELKVETGDDDPTLDFYFDAHSVDAQEDEYADLDIKDKLDDVEEIVEGNPFKALANSIAPGIVGGETVDIETPWDETHEKYWWIRLSAGIANLFGSWRRSNGDGTYQRGDSHILLIGDPSTGKSTIMNAVENISPRSAFASGKNATGAGLTAAAVNDDFAGSQWSLEAGALVKAHNGVACIDEIDKMNSEHLDQLHSALEKQRLEFDKAGIDATLKCETSMLASGNPEGSRFDDYDKKHSQIDIVESLMDRFDLVFTLEDKPDLDKDELVAESTINQRAESALEAKGEIEPEEKTAAKAEVNPKTLRAWVAHARSNVQPVIRDSDVKQRIKEYYVSVRQENQKNSDDGEEPVPATVRTLDGILRLAEASARMRLSEAVEMIDAEMAIAMMKASLEDIGYDPETGKLDADWYEGRGSWSQEDRIKRVRGIVEELETAESGADIEEVIRLAEESGIDKEMAEKSYDKLSQQGEIYEPKTDQEVRLS